MQALCSLLVTLSKPHVFLPGLGLWKNISMLNRRRPAWHELALVFPARYAWLGHSHSVSLLSYL